MDLSWLLKRPNPDDAVLRADADGNMPQPQMETLPLLPDANGQFPAMDPSNFRADPRVTLLGAQTGPVAPVTPGAPAVGGFSGGLPIKNDVTEPAPPPTPEAPPEPSPGPTATPPPAAPPATTPARPLLRSMADKYGLDMADMAPIPLPSSIAASRNERGLGYDLARAGQQIGNSIAGVKNDPTAFDKMEARSASGDQAFDKDVDQLTDFRRKLALKAAEDRAGKAGKYDPALSDPNSPQYKVREAEYNATPTGRAYLASLTSNNGGKKPDFNYVNADPKNVLAGDTARTNNASSQAGQNARQEKAQGFTKEMNEVTFGQALTKEEAAEGMRLARDQRTSDHPFRDFANSDKPPPEEISKKVKTNDAGVQYVVGAVKELIQKIRETPNIDKFNPLENGAIMSLQQAILNQQRVTEGFGVPSGKDMEQLARQIADPTTFSSLVDAVVNGVDDGNNGVGKLKMLANQAVKKAEDYALNNGFGAYGAKTKQGTNPEEVVRKARSQGRGGFTAPPAAPAAPTPSPQATETPISTKTTPSGKPYAIKAMDKKTQTVHYFDANGDEVE